MGAILLGAHIVCAKHSASMPIGMGYLSSACANLIGMRASHPADIFLQGQFLGVSSRRRAVPGFDLRAMVPTVPEHEVHAHAHADAHFVLLIEGQYLSTAAGAAPVLVEPTLIYNPPGTVHRDRFRGCGGRFLTVSVSASALCDFHQTTRLPDHACVVGRSGLRAAALLVDALDANADTSDLTMEALCSELLTAAAACPESNKAPPSWLPRVRDLLHDACGSDLRLSELAHAAGVHSVYLTRAFKQYFRCTPGEYLRRCRLSKAAALLTSNGPALSDIAHACGYFDQAHFCRSFKLAYGLTPLAYRAHISR
jgi:AraC family transcriptional regulator